MKPRNTQQRIDLEYLIGTLFGDPEYGTGEAPDDTSLASQYVRDLLRQQEDGVQLVDLDKQAFNLGRSEDRTLIRVPVETPAEYFEEQTGTTEIDA